MRRISVLLLVIAMALVIASPVGAKQPTKQPTLYNVTMDFVVDEQGLDLGVDGLSTECEVGGSMEMVGTTRRGELTLQSDAAEIYIRAPSVAWEREYPTPSTGLFNGCHGPSISTPGDDGHLWIHFLADGTIELYWHFDYYLADNGKKGRSRETVRQNFSMAAVGAYAEADDTWRGTVQLGWFLVENGKVITDGYEAFPPYGTEMSFTLTVAELTE